MTSLERQITLINAVRYISREKLSGCLVECGVWRGGSSMAAALTLLQEGDTARDLYLYDTFEGMTPPTSTDRTSDGTTATELLKRDTGKAGVWCVAGFDEVKANMTSTGYPPDRIHYIRGPIEETVPKQAPKDRIAVLRLDTDWYESTKHELVHLYPLLREGGVLIIDDYGHWEGARKAVDEYFQGSTRPYLHRVDYTGRVLIKH